MRDLDDFNRLEENAWAWERILRERAEGIDEKSEQKANEMVNDELYEKLRNGDIPKMPPLQKIDPKTGKIQ